MIPVTLENGHFRLIKEWFFFVRPPYNSERLVVASYDGKANPRLDKARLAISSDRN